MQEKLSLCLLCNEAIADKTNSHILPSFLKKVIRYNNPKKHALIVDLKTGKTKPAQDIPKESFIFCSKCEECFEQLETWVGINLSQSEELRHRKDNPIFFLNNVKYQRLNNCEPKIFYLFIISILWRISITKNEVFRDFKLERKVEEELRILLKTVLDEKKEKLNENIRQLKDLDYPYIIFRPENSRKCTWSMFIKGSLSDGLTINALKYNILIFHRSSIKINKINPALNVDFDIPRIRILANRDWNSSNFVHLIEIERYNALK